MKKLKKKTESSIIRMLRLIFNIPKLLPLLLYNKKKDKLTREIISNSLSFFDIKDKEFLSNIIFELDLFDDEKYVRIDLTETFYNFSKNYPTEIKDPSYLLYFIRERWGENYVDFFKNML